MLQVIRTENRIEAAGQPPRTETTITYKLEKPEWGWFLIGGIAGFLFFPVFSFLRAAFSYY
jgi:hypothetical protein